MSFILIYYSIYKVFLEGGDAFTFSKKELFIYFKNENKMMLPFKLTILN
jgi:hypothetical protein